MEIVIAKELTYTDNRHSFIYPSSTTLSMVAGFAGANHNVQRQGTVVIQLPGLNSTMCVEQHNTAAM